jgi:hypothetical protein
MIRILFDPMAMAESSRDHTPAEEHRAKTACFSYEPDVDGAERVRYCFALEDVQHFLDRIVTY